MESHLQYDIIIMCHHVYLRSVETLSERVSGSVLLLKHALNYIKFPPNFQAYMSILWPILSYFKIKSGLVKRYESGLVKRLTFESFRVFVQFIQLIIIRTYYTRFNS